MSAQSTKTRVTVLGATGSIGSSTLDVLSRHPEQFEVFALSASRSVEKMVQLCVKHSPQYAVMADEQSAQELQVRLSGRCTRVFSGEDGLDRKSVV